MKKFDLPFPGGAVGTPNPTEAVATSGNDGCDNRRKALANFERSETVRTLFDRPGVPAPFDVGISQNANGKGRRMVGRHRHRVRSLAWMALWLAGKGVSAEPGAFDWWL